MSQQFRISRTSCTNLILKLAVFHYHRQSRIFCETLLVVITQINENVVRRLGIILEVINRNCSIDSHKLELYRRGTAKLAIRLYAWCYIA